MAIERPTFHESWYRVAGLHPQLRTTVQISRQHFRGQPWHVVQDHTNNAFFRLAEPAYRFIGLLDGHRTVADAWGLVNEQLGDEAPTQGEVIQLLGQLYTSNLLKSEVPADAHTLFARYKKRRQREVTSYLMNIMFARLPLVDPDAFLERYLPLLGWIFSPIGLVVWVGLMAWAAYSIVEIPGAGGKLFSAGGSVLSPDNLILLYVAFAMIKACHEMGHAISCKKFGKQSGTGGEVHIIGIMLLIFTPVPYVDASSSWALKNKWHRAIVGAAGMWVELAIASLAAVLWSHTQDSQWQHAFAYNVMFVASFSTVVFNANPLLRYDGYYILSDLLEIPNLAQRSKDYVYYLVKKYAWNVRFVRNPAYSMAEEWWLFTYAIASFLMRTVVSFSILFYLGMVLEGALIIIASIMAVAAVIAWAIVPLGKFVHYLVTSGELARVRTRAIATTAGFVLLVAFVVGFIPVHDRARAMGVVEPEDYKGLFAGPDGGFVKQMAEVVGTSGVNNEQLALPRVEKGELVADLSNTDLAAERTMYEADRNRLIFKMGIAYDRGDMGQYKQVQEQIDGKAGINQQIAELDKRIKLLQVRSPVTGVLVAPEMEDQRYAYMHGGDRMGLVANMDTMIVRVAAANSLGGPLQKEADREVEMRINGRPDIAITGRIRTVVPSGSNILPSPALGFQMGGDFNTAADDKNGTRTVENFFEVRIDRLVLKAASTEEMAKYKLTGRLPLLPGQRVLVRFELQEKPLAAQVWTSLLQLFQKKFQT